MRLLLFGVQTAGLSWPTTKFLLLLIDLYFPLVHPQTRENKNRPKAFRVQILTVLTAIEFQICCNVKKVVCGIPEAARA